MTSWKSRNSFVQLTLPVRTTQSRRQFNFRVVAIVLKSDPTIQIPFPFQKVVVWETFPWIHHHPVSCSSPFIPQKQRKASRRRWKFLVPADWPAGQLSLPTLKTELPFAPYKTMMHFRSNTKDVCLLHKWGKQRKITTNYPPHRHHGFMTHPKGKTNTFLARWCFSQIEPEKSKNTVTQYYEFTSMRISNSFDNLKYVTTHWLKY